MIQKLEARQTIIGFLALKSANAQCKRLIRLLKTILAPIEK